MSVGLIDPPTCLRYHVEIPHVCGRAYFLDGSAVNSSHVDLQFEVWWRLGSKAGGARALQKSSYAIIGSSSLLPAPQVKTVGRDGFG